MIRNQKMKYGAPIVGSLALASMQASAALPTDVTTAFGTLTTDGGSLMTLIWGCVTVFTLGFTYIKLFKKGVGKAT